MASSILPRVSRLQRLSTRVGFTLVELLVVIGIIALLIGILLPTLGKARESANSLKCQAQERQIVQAMMLHADEHQGYMPMVGLPHPGPDYAYGAGLDPVSLQDPRQERYDYYGTDATKFHLMSVLGALAPQLGQEINTESRATLEADIRKGTVRKLFVCPSDRDPVRIAATVWDGGDAYSSYGYNEAALGWGTSVGWDGGSGMTSNPYPHSRLRGKAASFVHPAQLFLFTDAAPRSDGGWQVYCDADANLTLRDFFVTTYGPPNNPHANMSPPAGYCAAWDVIDSNRHHGRMNVAFADGHVENVLLDEGSLAKISMNVDFPAD